MPSAMIGALSISVLFYFATINYIDYQILNIWIFTSFFIAAVRMLLFKNYKQTTITSKNIKKFYILFYIFLIISTFLWTLVPFILFPKELELQVLIVLLIGGLATGASVSLAVKTYMFNTFLFMSLVPILFTFFIQTSNVANSIMISILFYILFLYIISKKISAFIISSIKLNDENQKLIHKLEQKVDESKKANESKSKFLSVMSHEIRTPLNAIIGFVKILKKDEKDLSKKKYLDTIDSSSFLLMSIINDILDITKIEAGKFVIESIEYEPYKELYSIYDLYERTSSDNGINLINSISTDIPIYLKGDMLRLKQIISNLLSNAIKFTPKGKNIEFIATYNKEKSLLYIEIRDEGIGIKNENITNITKEFTQEDSSTARKYGGTGLGLSIVTKLLKLQNSELKIKSKIDVGSSFYFELPIESTKNKITENKIDIEYNFSGKKILVAEDNKTNQMLIEILLDDIGVLIKIANDGNEAEEIFNKEKFDLILMDINMPNKNGLEAMKSIKEINNKIPIIALTANAVSGDKEKYINEGFDDYLAKPIDNDALKFVLNKYLT